MLPPKEELMAMPLTILRNARIENKEEEKIVQEILNQRLQSEPPQGQIYRGDAIQANIQTKKEEAEWQKKIDERVEALKPQITIIEEPKQQEEPVIDIPPQEPVLKPTGEKEPYKFCQFCDSKGVKHKKNCIRPIK